MKFQESIVKALKSLTPRQLADILNTNVSNIKRWANGEAEPILPMQEVYLKKLGGIDEA